MQLKNKMDNHINIFAVVGSLGHVILDTCRTTKDQVEKVCADKKIILNQHNLQGSIEPFVIMSADEYRDFTFDNISGVAVKIMMTNPDRSVIYKLPAPKRHEHLKELIHNHYKKKPEDLGQCIYGFYSAAHEFLTRKDAQVIAIRNRQIHPRELKEIKASGQTELQSPNVW